jgi:5-formyltetrahydrofolate cyclo-ligase
MARLRESALAARRSLTNEMRDCATSKICKRIANSHEFISCKSIACYLPVDDEVDPIIIIERAWRAKKRVFAPVIEMRGNMIFRQLAPDTKLERNFFGIWEPVSEPSVSPRTIDLVIAPVVAFDNRHHRIGMGGGYYDRCFSFLQHRRNWLHPKLIGVAFACQEVEKITPSP